MGDSFGATFGRLMKRKRGTHTTQSDLARALYPNLDPEEAEKRKGDISKIETGKVANPNAATIKKICDVLEISDEELEALQARAQMPLAEQLDHIGALTRDQLELLASRFEIETPHALSERQLQQLLTQKAEEYRSLRTEVDAIDEGLKRLSNLKAAAQDAIARVDLDEVETLLSRVQEVEKEEAAKTGELRANNALLRGKVEQAYDLLSDAADAFRIFDPIEPARRRIKYEDLLYRHGLRYGSKGMVWSAEMLREAIKLLDPVETPALWSNAQNSLAIALDEQGTRTDGPDGTALLEEAVTAYRDALTVRTKADHPVDWAMTTHNLAIALQNQGTRTDGPDGTALLEEAVTAYRGALTVYTKADHPVDWAMTQKNLAIAEEATANHAATKARRPHLDAALAYVDASLIVYDPEHMPYDHRTATELRERILAQLAALDT